MGRRVFSINLTEEEYERLDRLSRYTRRPKAFYVKEALNRYLEEIEEVYLLERSLEKVRAGEEELVSLKKVKKQLDVR